MGIQIKLHSETLCLRQFLKMVMVNCASFIFWFTINAKISHSFTRKCVGDVAGQTHSITLAAAVS